MSPPLRYGTASSIALIGDLPLPPDLPGAACVGHELPSEAWSTPAKVHQANVPAIQVCLTCPVLTECFSYAMANEVEGIWGGELFKVGIMGVRRRRELIQRIDLRGCGSQCETRLPPGS